ncbi:MAG TPA: GerMN domain-containing protein [Actinomycetota bacterium]
MPDPSEWISRIREVEPPELWEEAAARASSVSESDRAAVPDGHPSSQPTNPRRAALVTGVAAGILALAIVVLASRTGPAEKGENRATPTPEVSSLSEAHGLLERLLGELWTAEARLAELQGSLEAAHDEVIVLQDELGPDPTDEQLREIEMLQERIQAWTRSVAEDQAVVSELRDRVEEARAARARLIPPPLGGVYPDVATVTCGGDYTGGTQLSTPVVRMQPDGVHFRVINGISNERVFLVIQPDGARAIPPGATLEVVIPPRPSHDVEVTCTFDYPRDSWERPTHPLWIERPSTCADDDERRNAAPVDGTREVSVYFSCEENAELLGTDGQPVYMFARSVPAGSSGTSDGRFESALRAYLAGPTPGEAEMGYFTPAPASLGAAIVEVSISEGTATVDFDASAEGDLGNLGTSTASLTFLTELRAVAFQFPEVDSLALRVDGDCDLFWHMLEMSCQTIRRADTCPTAQLAVSRLPWLPLDSGVPDPALLEDELGPVLVWFEDEDQRWAGRYVALKRSSEPVVGQGLSDFPTAEVRGEIGHLVWIGDPGAGEVALVWSEGVQPCSWFSLSMSSVGLTEAEAERTIRGLAAYVGERSP